MSVDIALKIGIGLLGASSISLGGYGLHSHLTATLENEYVLLEEQSPKWEQLVTKYETISKDDQSNSPIKIEGFSFDNETTDSQMKKQKLISQCQSLLKTPLRNEKETLDKKRKEIETWCTENATALEDQKH